MAANEEQRANCITCDIIQKLDELSPSVPEYCIFKVHDRLKRVNKEAYKPTTICIGPYHHHKRYQNTTLELMEEHKLRYLKECIHRINVSVLTYVSAMQNLEESTRNCYAEPINDLNSNEFVKMMLLDSCFIVEFLIKYETRSLRDKNDPIFQMEHIMIGIIKDLLLLENQLPFFVLNKVFEMAQINFGGSINMAKSAFGILLPSAKLASVSEIHNIEIKHLLSLMHCCWCFPKLSEGNVQDDNMVDGTINHNRWMDSTVKILIEQLPTCSCISVPETSSSHRLDGVGGFCSQLKERYIKAVTELQEFGIKFKRFDSSKLFDIIFKNGTIGIPPLLIQDGTEFIFRNLIAYEQCLPNNSPHPKYFTDYVMFMDNLINSSKDVETLRHREIIFNYLGEDEAISTIFNKLCLEINESNTFLYTHICIEVNKHCERKRNRWMASLRRNYCNSPWTLISILAAVILLLLTVAQTVFSVLSVAKGD